VEVADQTGAVLVTIDVNDITGIRRSGSSVTINRQHGDPVTLECASLDDAGRLEATVRPHIADATAETRAGRERAGHGLRLATMILALVLMIPVFLQSCAASIGGSLGDDEDLSGAAGLGIFTAFLFLLGGALVLAFPRVATGLFITAAVFAFIGAAAAQFTDLYVWGIVAIVLAAMAYFGHRKRRQATAT
jgi:hypothetical protein